MLVGESDFLPSGAGAEGIGAFCFSINDVGSTTADEEGLGESGAGEDEDGGDGGRGVRVGSDMTRRAMGRGVVRRERRGGDGKGGDGVDIGNAVV